MIGIDEPEGRFLAGIVGEPIRFSVRERLRGEAGRSS